MHKPFPADFRRDVIAVARSSHAPMAQIARDFGISESCLARWLKLADREDGLGDRPGGQRSDGLTAVTAAAATAEQRLKELAKRSRQLEQENEVLRRATAYFARDVLPKLISRWSRTWPTRVSPSCCPAWCSGSASSCNSSGAPSRSASGTGTTRT